MHATCSAIKVNHCLKIQHTYLAPLTATSSSTTCDCCTPHAHFSHSLTHSLTYAQKYLCTYIPSTKIHPFNGGKLNAIDVRFAICELHRICFLRWHTTLLWFEPNPQDICTGCAQPTGRHFNSARLLTTRSHRVATSELVGSVQRQMSREWKSWAFDKVILVDENRQTADVVCTYVLVHVWKILSPAILFISFCICFCASYCIQVTMEMVMAIAIATTSKQSNCIVFG